MAKLTYEQVEKNEERQTIVRSGGIGTATVVQIVFLILKWTHLIDWSWFWVLFPTILGAGLLLLVVIIFFIVYFITIWRNRD